MEGNFIQRNVLVLAQERKNSFVSKNQIVQRLDCRKSWHDLATLPDMTNTEYSKGIMSLKSSLNVRC